MLISGRKLAIGGILAALAFGTVFGWTAVPARADARPAGRHVARLHHAHHAARASEKHQKKGREEERSRAKGVTGAARAPTTKNAGKTVAASALTTGSRVAAAAVSPTARSRTAGLAAGAPPPAAPVTAVGGTGDLTVAAVGAGSGGPAELALELAGARPPATVTRSPRPASRPAPPKGLYNEPMELAAGPWQGLSMQAATKLSIPILFGATVALFVLLQALVDPRATRSCRRAPERGDDDTVGFG